VLRLSKLIDRSCIKLDMKALRKKDAISELLDILKDNGKIEKTELLLADICEREKSASTGIGLGVAIPHKIVKGLEKTVIAFGRKKEGINFDSIDGKPAFLFFLILGREGSTGYHLRLLSKLARLLHDPDFRDLLYKANSPDDIIAALSREDD
jgi:fructose-specific phosphotransferase system IIA component